MEEVLKIVGRASRFLVEQRNPVLDGLSLDQILNFFVVLLMELAEVMLGEPGQVTTIPLGQVINEPAVWIGELQLDGEIIDLSGLEIVATILRQPVGDGAVLADFFIE